MEPPTQNNKRRFASLEADAKGKTTTTTPHKRVRQQGGGVAVSRTGEKEWTDSMEFISTAPTTRQNEVRPASSAQKQQQIRESKGVGGGGFFSEDIWKQFEEEGEGADGGLFAEFDLYSSSSIVLPESSQDKEGHNSSNHNNMTDDDLSWLTLGGLGDKSENDSSDGGSDTLNNKDNLLLDNLLAGLGEPSSTSDEGQRVTLLDATFADDNLMELLEI